MKKLCVAVFAILLILCSCAEKSMNTETKNITLSVITTKTETFKLKTDKKYLGEVLKDNNLVEGENGQYGLFITSVNGIKADENKQEWWCLTKDNESIMTGADKTPVSDGDKFELTLKQGY